MRLTTKIIIGIILSILLISMAFIASLSFSDKKNFKRSSSYNVELSQNNITGIELSSFNTIVIDEVPYESEEYKYYISNDCHVYFDSITEKDDPDMMFIPESFKDFVLTDFHGDTLKIKLDKHGIGNKYKSEEHRHHSILGLNISFRVSKIDIINNVQNLSVNVSNIETDSIKIISYDDIIIKSCKAQYIAPILKTNHKKLEITNSEAKRVNLDIDDIRNWNIENCNIEEQYITGSRKHHITQHRKESGIINWIPKNNNAELNINVKGDTTQIIFP